MATTLPSEMNTALSKPYLEPVDISLDMISIFEGTAWHLGDVHCKRNLWVTGS
jgi:hypothetical protein